jgi:type II secretion system protein G
MTKRGFTLVELLVVISIIGILLALSVFGIQGSREASRDAKRKADLELVRSGLEIYKSDCGDYPAALSSPLVGDGSPTSCAVANTYISSVPTDPSSPGRSYRYSRLTATTYEICTALEQGSGTVTCGGSSNCGSTCNYKVTNP